MRRLASRLAGLAMLVSVGLASCAWEEHMCSDGEYPAWRPDGPGGACFRDGRDPKPGYVSYPEGDVPELVADDYRPLRRYPELRSWAKEYVAWQEGGQRSDPPRMPDVG